MRFGQLCGLFAAGLLMTGCAAGISHEAAEVIRSGAPYIDVATNPSRSYNRTDGSYCEEYRIYESGSGVARQGTAVVCRYTGQKWILVARAFDPVGTVGSTPVPPTSTPVVIQPAPPPPSGGTGSTGWQPVTQ